MGAVNNRRDVGLGKDIRSERETEPPKIRFLEKEPRTMNVLDSFSLRGKVAVMTGAAGLYGRQIAEALAEAGAKTFLADCNREALEAVAKTMCDAGLDAVAVEYDQGDPASVERMRDEVVASAGRLDILVNCAVLRPMADWTDPLENWAESMRINATGLLSVTRTVGDYMAAHGGGSIINIGSIQGMVGPDYSLYEGLNMISPPDYYFNKGGMIQLTRYVASRLGPQGVRCNVICPGGFLSGQDPRFIERYNQRTFVGRMANESDLKGIIVFLASDASAYITGANIPVDGGYTSK